MKCRTVRGTVTISEAKLKAMYRAAEMDRRRYEPHVRGISFAQFRLVVCQQLQMAATDPGGDIDLNRR